MITAINEIDMLPLIEKLNHEYHEVESRFAGIEMMPYFVKAATLGLNEFPAVNNQNNHPTILIKYPSRKAIISDAAGLEIEELSDQLIESLTKEMQGVSTAEQSSDVTFAIVNIPSIYLSVFPEVSMTSRGIAILTLYAIQEKPIVIDSVKVEVRPQMFITLSYHPKQVTSNDAKRFLEFMKRKIESPEELDTFQYTSK